MPNLFIIAGPNGAGKSTYVKRFLPQEMHCQEFVNADLIAAGLSPFNPASVSFSAGRIMLHRVRELIIQRRDFSFETTLSGRAHASLLREARTADYRIRLDFLWIPSLSITRDRVAQRVRKGGHHIPEEIQQRRFHLGIRNLAQLYRPLLHEWRLYDNTDGRPRLIARERDDRLEIADAGRLAIVEQSANVTFMNDSCDSTVEDPATLRFDDETRRSLRAMRRAFADVVLENKQWGLPIIQWREGIGKVEIPAEQLEPFARRILEVDGDPLPEEEEKALLAHVKI